MAPRIQMEQEATSSPEALLQTQLEALRVFLSAIYPGRVLSEVIVRIDGVERSVRVPLPAVGQPTNEDDTALTPTRQKILDILAASPVPLTRKQVAAQLGRDVSKIGGKLGLDFATLARGSLLFERDGYCADDDAKFEGFST